MENDRWQLISRVYHEAAARQGVDRADFLQKACGSDERLRQDIESILAIPSAILDSFLEESADAVDDVPTTIAGEGALVGRQLGVYRVQALLDVGGMSEVYRARDTRLGRDVALKILPYRFTADADRLARLEREARLLASLNHPHIATLLSVEESDGVPALVMELVEGETLAVRCRRGPLPLSEVVTIARQIVDALDSAHDKGIVHRDLKPANVKITPDGTVKVLDFGLAKVVSDAATRFSEAPTTTDGTRRGVRPGTPAYMSPEQARGKAVDKRADIWAFGCVVFEMLTGQRAFTGETVSDTLVAVLEREPDWTRLPASTPPTVRRLLSRCLVKDPKHRLRDIGDASLELDETRNALMRPPQEEQPKSAPGRTSRLWIAGTIGAPFTLIGLLAIALVLLMPWARPGAPALSQFVRFTVGPPFNTSSWPRISPDGHMLVFGALNEGHEVLWVRPLDQVEVRPLAGTVALETPFWSADSRLIAFFANGKLKAVPAAGGAVQTVTDAQDPAGGDWNREGVILFAAKGIIYRVRADGSGLAPATALDATEREYSHAWPEFLPDGRRFFYVARSSQREESGVYLASLDSNTRKRILPAFSRVVYARSGHLLFVRDGALMAQRFDERVEEMQGTPTPLVPFVQSHPAGDATFDVSDTGVMIYRAIETPPISRLALMDRGGRELDTIGPSGFYRHPRFSPDGRRIAVERYDAGWGSSRIWLFDLERHSATRLTSGDAQEVSPEWSPDGRQISFSSTRGKRFDIYLKTVDGTDRERLVVTSPDDKYSENWSPDGLLASVGRSGLWLFPVAASGAWKQVRAAAIHTIGQATLAPDGHAIAYASSESGRPEVYVETFPDTGHRWQISEQGGAEPHWRRDGKELFYISMTGTLMSIEGAVGSGPRRSQRLFDVTVPEVFGRSNYGVSPDGRRFAVNTMLSAAAVPPIQVVLNWTALLAK